MSFYSSGYCQHCGDILADCGVGRPPSTCSNKCRQALYRQRNAVKPAFCNNSLSGFGPDLNPPLQNVGAFSQVDWVGDQP